MANIEIGKLLYKIGLNKDGKFDSTLKKTETSVKKLGVQTGKASKKTNGLARSFKALKSKIFAVGLVFLGLGLAIGKSLKAFNKQEVAEARLEQIARKVTGATEEQIQGYKDLAREMQKVGVLGDEVIISGQSQLASFTKNAEVVRELSDDLADLAVATYGTNVSQEQAIQTANNLGKALSGQLGALTRTGILVSENLEKAFKEANNEQERAVILSKIIQDNYGGLNKTLRETTEGRLRALKNSFGDLVERIGGAIVPAFESLISEFQTFIDNTDDSEESFEKFSLGIYKGTNAVISFFKSLGLITKGFISFVKITVKSFQTFGLAIDDTKNLLANFSKAFLLFSTGKFKQAKKLLSESVKNPFERAKAGLSDLKEEVIISSDKMADSLDSFNESSQKMFGEGFKSAYEKTTKALTNIKTGLDGNITSINENEKGLDEWTKTIEKAKTKASELAKELRGDLKDSFDEFSQGIGQNIEETTKGLAEIVIQAEQRKDEIKDALKTASGDERTRLNDELKGVKDVLNAREDFEKEHLEKITSIRAKLTEAGVDPDTVGITTGEDSGLEEEIAEKKRLASLDEFTRFKELQFAKLDALTESFLAETRLFELKIEKQKSLELGLTQFINEQNQLRQQSFKDFQMGDYSTQSGLVQQSRNETLGGNVGTTNTNNVNVNIGGTAQPMNAEELASSLNFELSKFQ